MLMSEYFTLMSRLTWRDYVRHSGAFLLVPVIVAVMAPFSTHDDPFWWRLGYWLLMLLFFVLVLMPLNRRVMGRFRWLQNMPVLIGTTILILISSIPMAMFVNLVDYILLGLVARYDPAQLATNDLAQHNLANILPLTREALGVWLLLYLRVLTLLVVNAALFAFFVLVHGYLRRAAQQTTTADTADTVAQDRVSAAIRPGTGFFSRLPDAIGTDLVCLKMEDHYVRVIARGGEALVLMRLRDAIAELDGLPGLRVHRSWWVAADKIVKLSKSGRRVELLMVDGLRIPVSESYRPALDTLLSGGSGSA